MEEIIDDIVEIKKFINDHLDSLMNEDYTAIYELTSNDKIKKYLVEQNYIILNDEQLITTLSNPNKKDILISLLEKKISINTKNNGNTLLDNTIIQYINEILVNNKEQKQIYLEYILYLLSVGAEGNLMIIYNLLNNLENSEIYSEIIDIIDLLLLHNAPEIEIDTKNEIYVELFKNMSEKNIIISDTLTELIINNKDMVRLNIYNYVNKIDNKKSTVIKINQNEKYVLYEENSIKWVFNNDDIKKIKQNKLNPYTKKIIDDETLKYIENNY